MRHYPTFLLIVFAVVGGARHACAIPADDLLKSLQPTADVNDFAGLLSPAEKEALEARCKLLRKRTGAQLAVVTLKSLRGGQIEDFAEKLFKRWGIGQKKNNGLLLIVAMEDRGSRIEVGYGLEPIVPDVLAARILDHELRPRFRQQQYAAGLSAAVNSLCELVERGVPADREALAAREHPGFSTIAFLTVFVILGSFILGGGLGSRSVPSTLFGLLFAGIPMAIASGIAAPLALVLQVPLSLVSAVLGYHLARPDSGSRPGRRRGSARRPTSDWGVFNTPGGGWSSGGGGFSGGWGGFGGGSSGGGGASSSW